MTDERLSDIPPALSPEEWQQRATTDRAVGMHVNDFGFVVSGSRLGSHAVVVGRDVSEVIALANDAMNDEDPRKFTWAQVGRLRGIADTLGDDGAEFLHDLADVVSSYLPAPG